MKSKDKQKSKEESALDAVKDVREIDVELIKELSKYNSADSMKRLLNHRQKVMNNISNFSSLVFAGILSKVITNPLERMKLIQQTRSVWETNALLRMNQKSVIELFKEIRETQGLPSFWRGTSANIWKTIPTSFLRIAIFDQLRALILYKGDIYYKRPEKYIRTTIAAFFGSVLSNLIVYPFERVRVLMSLNMRSIQNKEKDAGVIKTMAAQMRNEGFLSLYRGYLLNSVVTVPSTAVTLIFYDFYRDYLFKQGYLDLYSRYTLIGLVSTLTSQALLYPLDTIRRQLQADSSMIAPKRCYKNTRDCFRKIKGREGIAGFYRGLPLNLVKTPIQTILQLVSYEYFRRTFENVMKY